MKKFLIAGLGNIGPDYVNTRHNAGFLIADELVGSAGASFDTGRYGDLAKLKFRGRNILVLKPSTFMNNSGRAIRYWLNQENIPLQNLLVVLDDIALPIGILRFRKKGGPGGHNGLISIIEMLGTTNFNRLRIGIGDAFSRGTQVNYVLGEWTDEERSALKKITPQAVEMIKSFIAFGPDKTMNEYNSKT